MSSDEKFRKFQKLARKRISSLDAIDKWEDRMPGTILAALEGGLKLLFQNDPKGVDLLFEAMEMLRDVVPRRDNVRN